MPRKFFSRLIALAILLTSLTTVVGFLSLNFSDGSSGVLPYVKVWAYAEDNQTDAG